MLEKQDESVQARLAIWEMVLELLRRAHTQHFPGGQLGHDLPSLLILGAVIASRTRGFPASASKIGSYLGYPRETVRRHMDDLVLRGLLQKNGRLYGPTEKSATTRHLAALVEIVQRTAGLLEKRPK